MDLKRIVEGVLPRPKNIKPREIANARIMTKFEITVLSHLPLYCEDFNDILPDINRNDVVILYQYPIYSKYRYIDGQLQLNPDGINKAVMEDHYLLVRDDFVGTMEIDTFHMEDDDDYDNYVEVLHVRPVENTLELEMWYRKHLKERK